MTGRAEQRGFRNPTGDSRDPNRFNRDGRTGLEPATSGVTTRSVRVNPNEVARGVEAVSGKKRISLPRCQGGLPGTNGALRSKRRLISLRMCMATSFTGSASTSIPSTSLCGEPMTNRFSSL
jgi:hypothetical protein